MATLNVKNLPERLYRKLRDRAKREHRSVAQEVIHVLEEALDVPAPASILELKGLGKGCWKGLDPAAHVKAERDSWD
ncbi:MAG: Arc family DNA-binding protein [Planctomycetes bacterium]|nr:Arc family DNA-binding protein [Planctomycetota bacterium]